jgi:very-short-patch-repair endonuclease
MRGSQSSGDIDRAISTLAGRQYGVVSRAQLVALGIDRGAVERRLASGRLLRLHRGVYAVGHRAPRREARWLAAVLACGDGAVLSRRSAAALWGIRNDEGPRPDVAVASPRHPGVAAHAASLATCDVTVRLAIPVTSPARTLVELARVVDPEDLVRAVRQAQFLRLFHVPSMQDVLQRRPSSALRRLIDDIAPTQSILEDRLLSICDRHRIPRPLTQQPIGGRRVDFLWPGERVVVETDGWEGHSTPSAFQLDRTTSNALQLAGYAVLRFTHADIPRLSRQVAREIRAALGPHAANER